MARLNQLGQGGESDLARQSRIYCAQKRAMTAEEEEKQKKELIVQQTSGMVEKIEQMILMQNFDTKKHAIDKEHFSDNQNKLRQAHAKILRGLRDEEAASTLFEEMEPKLEAVVNSFTETNFAVAAIVQTMVEDGPMGQIGRKIIKYKAKEMAMQDAIMALSSNSSLTVQETQNAIRQLAKRQFKNVWKAKKLI